MSGVRGNTYPDDARADRMDYVGCIECGNEIIGLAFDRMCRSCAFEFGETDGEGEFERTRER